MEVINTKKQQEQPQQEVEMALVQLQAPRLPDELWSRILYFVGAPGLCTAAQVSRAWYGLACDNVLWRKLTEVEFGRVPEPEGHYSDTYKRLANVRSIGPEPQLVINGNANGQAGQAAAGEFDAPQGVATDKKYNEIVIADGKNKRIQFFDKDGHWLRSLASSAQYAFDDIADVATDNDGRVYVSDFVQACVQVFQRDGSFVSRIPAADSPKKLATANGVTVDSRGNVIVVDTENAEVNVFSQAGEFLRPIGGADLLSFPIGVAVDAQDNVFVVDCHPENACVQVFDRAGKHIRTVGKALLQNPQMAALDAAGHLFVTDEGLHEIVIFDSRGNEVHRLGAAGCMADLRGLAIDGQNRLITTDTGKNCVSVF